MNESSIRLRNDRRILREIAAGDRRALRDLYDRHAPWLTLRLSRRCSDADFVDEVVQDTFVAIWRKPSAYRGRGEVAVWIWGIAIRRLIDKLRRRSANVAIRDLPGPEPSGEDRVLLGVEYGDLAEAFNRLSPELRAVVQATLLDGLTTKEAARFLDVPEGTVKTRMMRARAQLGQRLA